jgi:hypothetical protein
MAAPSLDSLRAPANGQILSLKKPLSKAAVEAAFSAAADRASKRVIVKEIRRKRTTADRAFWASLVAFPLGATPSFFPNTPLKEQTYGFLLLIEIETNGKWFLGMFKKNAASLNEWLDARAKHLPRASLTNAFGDGTRVNRLNLQRMTVSQHELRGASYEAADLQTSLPMMAASRCAIRSVRFDDDIYGSVSVTVSTSRVQRSGGRSTVEDLAELVWDVVDETLEAKSNPFLGGFAQAIPLDELPAAATPTSVLFDWSTLLDTDDFELRRAPTDGNQGAAVNKRLLTRICGETIPLAPDGANWQFRKEVGPVLGTFAATATKFSIRTLLGNRLVVEDVGTEDTMPLARWVREHDAYSITFAQPEYFFGSGALYRRASFASEIDSVRRCLRPEPALGNATSEKGDPAKTDSQFPLNSIFRVVEDAIYPQREWLCCADLGDEWADYLCIRDGRLIFIHCKGGKETTGASSFQEVVGQGLKNLGRIQSTRAEFRAKLAATKNNKFWAGTKIARLRDANGKWSDFEVAIVDLLGNPNAAREVHLVVTMLSKAAFDAAAVTVPPAPYFIQLVWLLAAFIDSCREMGAKPVIVCKQ